MPAITKNYYEKTFSDLGSGFAFNNPISGGWYPRLSDRGDVSIGNSLLDFMDKSEMDFSFLYRDKSFKTTYFDKPKTYDDIK